MPTYQDYMKKFREVEQRLQPKTLRRPLTTPQPTYDVDLQELVDRALAGLFGGDGGGFDGGVGGYAPPAWTSTEAAARLAQQFELEQLAKEQAYAVEAARVQREWETAEAARQREFERAQALEELKAERQRIFTEMLGKDPVRAALFAMGVGGEILPGGERFAALPPLKGAEEYGRRAATGLSELLGRTIGVGEAGVTGLPEVYKAAGAYSAGYRPTGRPVGDIEAARTMLLSGFGVGAVPGKGRPGISPEEALRRIQSVTPTGVFGQ